MNNNTAKAITKIKQEKRYTKIMIGILGSGDNYWPPYLDGLEFAIDCLTNICQNNKCEKPNDKNNNS